MNENPSAPSPAARIRPLTGFDRVIQVGVVVRNIEQVIERLADLFGIGPFRVVDCPPPERKDRQFYHGQPANFRTRQAFADLGSIELELIEPLEGRTIWSDFLAQRGPGIHHIRFNVPDQESLTAYLRGRGIGKTQEGAGIRDGSYWVNYDTEKLLGFIVEILQPAPDSDGRTPGAGRRAARGEARMNGPFDFTDKIALVTGASRGLGRHFAQVLAKAGADVIITARKAASLEQPRAEIESLGRRCLPLALDVTSHESICQMAADALAAWGRIDILVNNAGCNIRKPALDLSWDDWNQVLDTNLRRTVFVAQAVAPSMIQRGWGRIINIGSLTCVFGYAGIGPYCASRGGIRQLTMSLADDWGPHGVTVNCLAPGWFKTDQTAALYENAQWLAYLCDRLPLKRPGRIEELDGALLFLASESASYVTGQTLLIDGGMSTGATRALVRKPLSPTTA